MFNYHNDNYLDREQEASELREFWEAEGFDEEELDFMEHKWKQD